MTDRFTFYWVPVRFLAFSIAASCAIASAATPPITSVAFAPDGKQLVTVSQVGITVYQWPTLQAVATYKSKSPNLHDLSFSPDGKRLAVAGGTPADSGSVEIFSWPQMKPLHAQDRHSDSATNVVWIDNDTIASSSLDHEIVVWDLSDTENSPKVSRVLKGHSRGVTALCPLAANDILISAGIDQSLRVWRLSTGELIRSLSIHTLPVTDLAVRPGDHALPMVASASRDRTVRFWQPTIGRMVRFARLPSTPLAISWNQDGSLILAGCEDGKVRSIDPDTVEIVDTQQGTKTWAYALAVHPSENVPVVGQANGELNRYASDDVNSSLPKDLVTPTIIDDPPAAGKRVRQTAPEYVGTEVYHSLYLPVDWEPNGKFPVIVEYTGNKFPPGKGSGEVKDANLGYGMSGGRKFIWVVMPYVQVGKEENAVTWWGDKQATIEYCKTNLPRICQQFGGDTENVFVCGFSRGAIATSYIALADDEIAGFWKGVFTFDHFDGQKRWIYANSDRDSALTRLARLKGRSVLVCGQHASGVHDDFLKDHLELADFEFLDVPTKEIFQIPEGPYHHSHTDLWMHRDSPYRDRAREWIQKVLAQ